MEETSSSRKRPLIDLTDHEVPMRQPNLMAWFLTVDDDNAPCLREDTPRPVQKPPPPPFAPGLVPYAHQTQRAAWMLAREEPDAMVCGIRGGIINWDMGLGKTGLALMAIWTAPPTEWPTLLVCPLAVLDSWEDNLASFIAPEASHNKVLVFHASRHPKRSLDHLRCSNLRGLRLVLTTYDTVRTSFKGKKKEALLDEVVRRDGDRNKVVDVRRYCAAPSPHASGVHLLHNIPWARVIFDESQRVINERSVGYKACMALAAPRRWSLTGTLLRNYVKDYWAQLRLVGYTGVDTAKAWNKRAHVYWAMHGLGQVVHTLTYEEAGVALPTQHEHDEIVTLAPRERLAYEAVEQELADVFHRYQAGVGDSTYADVLAQVGRMRRAAVSATLLDVAHVKAVAAREDQTVEEEEDEADDEDEEMVAETDMDRFVHLVLGEGGIGASKIQRALAIVDTFLHAAPAPGAAGPAKIIIFSHFTSVLDLVALALRHSAVHSDIVVMGLDGRVRDPLQRRAILRAFDTNRDSPCVLLLSGKVGGEGLTITAATGGILMEPHWTKADARQQKRRFHRIGQTQETHWWTLYAEETIETFVLALCARKDTLEHTIRHGGRVKVGANKAGMGEQRLTEFLAERGRRMKARTVDSLV